MNTQKSDGPGAGYPDRVTLTPLRQNRLQRYYQLNFRVERVFLGGFFGRGHAQWATVLAADPLHFREGAALDEDLATGFDKICVSDASTHVERLVFPAFYVVADGERVLVHRNYSVDGLLTMKIHGGDPQAVFSDVTYARHLWLLNHPTLGAR
jgi:hypothetical protein